MCNNLVIAIPLPGSTFTSLLQDSLLSLLLCLDSCCPHLASFRSVVVEHRKERKRARVEEGAGGPGSG